MTAYKKVIPIILLIINVTYPQINNHSTQLTKSVKNSKLTINLQNNFGYTLIDVAQAMEIQEATDLNREGLVDWGQFNYKGLVQIFIPKGKTSFGIELGFNSLYKWEEAYYPGGLYYDETLYYRWGTIWTWHIGALIQMSIANKYYVTTGAGVYTYFNGTGTTVGFPLGFGHIIKISDTISLPIEFRTDIIFGNGTPITVGGGIGLKFTI